MRDFSEHDLAIVNSAGVLVGVVTASDIIEEFHAEAMGDIAKLSALPEVDFSANLFKNALSDYHGF